MPSTLSLCASHVDSSAAYLLCETKLWFLFYLAGMLSPQGQNFRLRPWPRSIWPRPHAKVVLMA